MKKKSPIRGNKTKTRRQTFTEGSLERKAKFHEKQQSRFDAQTERMIAKFSGNLNQAS
jgi:hypothetical protein